MKHNLFNYKYIIAHHVSGLPGIYSKISQKLTGKNWFTTKDTDIVIDGFPRCANTYATFAFETAQTKKNIIAHHIHKKSQFLIAEKYNIPAILLIRNPVDSIASLQVRQPKYDIEILFKGYYLLYNDLRKRNNYVVGEFDEVLNNYGNIIEKVNRKFNSNFEIYKNTPQNEKRVKEIIHTQDELVGAEDYKQRVAYPDAERKEAAKNITNLIKSEKYASIRQKCENLYHEIISR